MSFSFIWLLSFKPQEIHAASRNSLIRQRPEDQIHQKDRCCCRWRLLPLCLLQLDLFLLRRLNSNSPFLQRKWQELHLVWTSDCWPVADQKCCWKLPNISHLCRTNANHQTSRSLCSGLQKDKVWFPLQLSLHQIAELGCRLFSQLDSNCWLLCGKENRCMFKRLDCNELVS